ncbi:DUF726 domain-containing protein [Halosolutus amylolyticus]|uniref:DUF726 domain-containing protein n=1 Tax=Halosolutus amylolyticus TaxID=2932267 RepID=A0ABD5PW16_9EURY|nr:DUF726 domain-containing protein [Halosolutus amylolyticus]
MSGNDESTGEQTIDRRTILRGATASATGIGGLVASSGSVAAGSVTGGCLTHWPEPIDERIDVAGDTPVESGAIPGSGDLLLYVHGLFGGEGLEDIAGSGANQATALVQGLAEEGVDRPAVAAMWDSNVTWTVAKWRANDAGTTLAAWLNENGSAYDSITIVAHSLGARVTLAALTHLDGVTIDSVALLGGAIDPDAVCGEFEDGIRDNAGHVYNYHSANDDIVCTIYAIREWTAGIGCSGSDCSGWFTSDDPPENFTDVPVDSVDGHCNYFKPSSIEFDGENCLDELRRRQF